jgi:choline dehydrogenase
VRFIAENAGAGFHQVGTCSAGRDAKESVVDPHFRVWGIDNLRVVDASVIPEVPIVNIHAPVLALAELAAELMGFAPHHHDHC